MPQISHFFGIAIYMYYSDHAPPHFHAEYGEDEAVYAIETLELLRGRLPRRAHSLVVEWHRSTVMNCAPTGPGLDRATASQWSRLWSKREVS